MTPLERAAAAVRDTLQKQADQSGSWITEQHPDTRVWSYEGEIPDTAIVRAVLTAIREPGAEVINKGGVGFCSRWVDPWDEMTDEEREMLGLPGEPSDRMEPACEAVSPIVSRTWAAMIDAILASDD